MRRLALTVLGCGFVLHGAEFRAGTARASLDPPGGSPMAGYGSARFAKGTLDPLEARVLAVSDGARSLALVTLDLCYTFEPAIMEQIRNAARGAVGEVVFHASHTHSGPAYSAAPEAAAHAAPRVAEAIRAAAGNLEPARIGTGWGQAWLGFNRRYVRLDGSVRMFWRNETRVSSTFPVDPTVGVIRIDRAGGAPLAVLVNYACHPVVLGPDNLDYSADYPSEMRRHIEERIGGGVMAFFLQGAPGDINPYFDKTPLQEDAVSLMKQAGRELGEEAVRVAGTIRTSAPPEPAVESRTATVTARNRWDVAHLREIVRQQYRLDDARAARLLRETMDLPVTTVLLNRDLALVGFPGEPFVEFQMQLRARSPLPRTFLLGYTNGYFAYFPTIAAAVRGGYGASSTVVPTEVGTGERLLDAALVSIYHLLGKLSDRPESPR